MQLQANRTGKVKPSEHMHILIRIQLDGSQPRKQSISTGHSRKARWVPWADETRNARTADYDPVRETKNLATGSCSFTYPK